MSDRWEYVHDDGTPCAHGPDPTTFGSPFIDINETPGLYDRYPVPPDPRCRAGRRLGWALTDGRAGRPGPVNRFLAGAAVASLGGMPRDTPRLPPYAAAEVPVDVPAEVFAEACHLAALWAARTGQSVTVFTAAAPIRGGQLVEPCGSHAARPSAHPATGIGSACHDAEPGGLIAVTSPARRLPGFRGGAIPDRVMYDECPCGLHSAHLAGPQCGPIRWTAPAQRAGADAEQLEHAAACGDVPLDVVQAAQGRRPGPLESLPADAELVVAATPGAEYEAWRHVASGVWIGRPGEKVVELDDEDPAAPRLMTAGQLRAQLAEREA